MFEIYADGKLLFATRYTDNPDYQVLSPKVEFSEIGRAGSCTFTMLPGHPFYNLLQEKKTNILVKANDSIIFKGCVSSAVKDFYNQKEVRCEGDLTYLFNSQVRPCKLTKNAEDLFRYYIDEHNKRVLPDRRFVVGIIDNDNAKTEVTLDESSFQDTKSAIEGNLIDYYGGYLRTRYQNGTAYIDWIKEYNRKSSQVIAFGENLLDISQEVSPDDIFTVLIPIGQDGINIASVNDEKDYLEVDEAIDKWGRIEKTVDFSNISDPEKLKEAGLKYISTNYEGSPISITLTAINLAHVGANVDDIFIGDKVRIVSIPHGLDKEYVCVSISYDLYYPDKTSYTFGKKVQDLTRRYIQNARTTADAISEAHSSAGRGIGGVNNKLDKYIKTTNDTLTLQHENIVLNADRIAMNAKQIEMNAEQITLRATKEEANALGKRLSTVEIDLNGDETRIGLKAELRQTIDDLDGLDSRLSRAEIDINGAEGAIGLKTLVAENREWLKRHDGTIDVLDRRVSQAEIDINGAEGTIGLKTSVETLKKNFDDNKKQITSIHDRLSKAEIDINGAEGTIGLKASVSDIHKILDKTNQTVTGINSRLTSAEIDINGNEGTIGLKTKVTSTIKRVDENSGQLKTAFEKISAAEIDIDAQNAVIKLKASQDTVNKIADRVTKAESTLTVQANSIESKVSKNGIISSINQTAEEIKINASKINLKGYVTASQLQAEVARVDRFFSGDSVISYLHATKASIGGALSCGGPFKVGEHTLGFKAMTVVNSFTQASGETSTGDSYVLAGSITIPGPTVYTPEAGTTIPL